MDRRMRRKLERSFRKRGGMFGLSSDASPEMVKAFLGQLLGCPECRDAVLEACNGDDRKNVDIDAVIRNVASSREH